MTSDKFVLVKDLVIPAGTVFDVAPTRTIRHTRHVQTTLELGRDSTISVTVPVDEMYQPFDEKFKRLKL